MLMGKLAGTVHQAACRAQSVEGVVVMKHISHSEGHQLAEFLNSLDVGFGSPDGKDNSKSGGRPFLWKCIQTLLGDSSHSGGRQH